MIVLKKFIIAGLVILCSYVGFAIAKEIPNLLSTNKMNAQYENIETQIKNYNKKTKNITNKTIETDLKKQNINLDLVKTNIVSKINQGLDLAYNHSHNEKEVENVKENLPKLIGKSFSNAIMDNNVATTTRNGLIYPFAKLDQAQVSFGNYDLSTNTMPIQINVQYQTNLGKGTTDAYGMYYGTVNAKTGKITNIQYLPMTSAQKAKAGDE